ncbi:MAG: hypothetical protein GKR94_00510 [Gammaproteobacteria bacterium]|nr:hypothetical protein [Gammaproteobacteria bacterium]
MQWVATSHAPLVLASFERNGIVALDGVSERGHRDLGHHIFGFSAGQIYDY